mmetsp:Transcript_52200/g.124432  ORF Transcript_52200/g.124432 Transcript_52200/m.124432 type:complete len:404 (-) Transcript_52200:636-1847(-)
MLRRAAITFQAAALLLFAVLQGVVGFEYNVVLQRESGDKLGLAYDARDGGSLLVEVVKAGGLFGLWNDGRAVEIGDRIFEVNGVTGASQRLLVQLKSGDVLRCKLRTSTGEEYTVFLDKAKGGKLGISYDATDGKTVLVESIADGIVKSWNTRTKIQAGDQILEVNGLSAPPAQPLLQQLSKDGAIRLKMKSSDPSGGSCAGGEMDGGVCRAPGNAQSSTLQVKPSSRAASQHDDRNHTQCQEHGFDPERLKCSTCRQLQTRLDQVGALGQIVDAQGGNGLLAECNSCCREAKPAEKFKAARLIADASSQDRDQDLHDFIKRKAPLFRNLEVEYSEGSNPAIELENPEDPQRVVRADVMGWKSDQLADFVALHLETVQADSEPGGEGGIVGGAWSAEIQSCSG